MIGIIAVIVLAILAIWLLTSIVGTIWGALVAIVIWAITGWLVGKLVDKDSRGFGTFGNIALGLAGGIVGTFVLRLLNLQGLGDIWLIGSIVVGVIGGLIIVFVARLLTNGRAFN
ncbi:MAG: hypothetical protein IAE89_16465 [Anaerolineae bacterium]|nr:hypothetical protein [Anaerolineae bacterium]